MRFDIDTSSTGPPLLPEQSSTAGNELLRVVCRLIVHIGHNCVHYTFNCYTTWSSTGYYSSGEKGNRVLCDVLQHSSCKFTSSSCSQTCIWYAICIACSLQLRAIKNSSVHILLSPVYSMQCILESVNIGIILLLIYIF